MSTIDSDDLGATGYFLPEDSQLRLKQLRDYMGFLANLARPRRPDEDQEWTAEIRTGEVSICLELLEEQIGLVLDELGWPAERGEKATAPELETETAAEDKDEDASVAQAAASDPAESRMNEAVERYVSGVTLYQIDEINLLLGRLHAVGNVVACSDHAELSDATLSIMGDAIYRDVETLREIIQDVDGQRLESPRVTRPGVGEEGGTYHVVRARLPRERALRSQVHSQVH